MRRALIPVSPIVSATGLFLTVATTAVVAPHVAYGHSGKSSTFPPDRLTAAAAADQARGAGYRIEPRDVVTVTVDGQPDLALKTEVGDDGAVTLPLVGRVVLAGLTAEEARQDLARRLVEFIKDPRVSVAVERTERVFVFGEVARPGTYPLRENPTLLELLVRAGYKGPGEVLVVRPPDGGAGVAGSAAASAAAGASVGPIVPAVPGAASARVVHVNLWDLEREIERGFFAHNLVLNDGDTVFVPRFDAGHVYVSGEVRHPGAYPAHDGMTVRQVLALAGGPTERAAVGRVRLVRLAGDRLERRRARLEDTVRPGDTVSVPEVLRFPVVMSDVLSPRNRLPLELRAGNWLVVAPSLALRRIGFDTNALNSSGQTFADFTVSGGPALGALVDLGRVRVQGGGGVDFVYFHHYVGERTLDRRGSVGVAFVPVRPVTLSAAWSYENTRDRYSAEVDARPRRFVEARDVGLRVGLSRRLAFSLAGREWTNRLAHSVIYHGVDLREALTERNRSLDGALRYDLTPLSAVFVEGRAERHVYTYSPLRNADEAEFAAGVLFQPAAAIAGEASAGYLRYLALDPRVPDTRGPVGRVALDIRLGERTRLGLAAARSVGNAFRSAAPYAVVDSYGGSVRRLLFARWDVFFDTYREMYQLKWTGEAAGNDSDTLRRSREATQRYTLQLGVQVPGGARVALDATYWQRLTPSVPLLRDPFRDYRALRVGLTVGYGAFQVQSQDRTRRPARELVR